MAGGRLIETNQGREGLPGCEHTLHTPGALGLGDTSGAGTGGISEILYGGCHAESPFILTKEVI